MAPRVIALLFAFALTIPSAWADPIVFDDNVPDDGGNFVLLPFTVPDGTVEIEVKHQSLTSGNILDWGVNDPNGFRGWGGGNTENAVIGVQAASRSYLPGPIGAGTWQVVIGKAKIVTKPAHYHVEITLRTTATQAPQTERRPYQPVPALRATPGWYAGDLHVHSRESGDASPTLDAIATFAKGRGLDFVEISDHNTDSQLDYLGVTQDAHKDLLLIPGVEFTTYAGHANGIGATHYVDHKIGLPAVTIEGAAQAFEQQNAVFSINHPALTLEACIGCAWNQNLAPEHIHSVEIATGGWSASGQFFDEMAIQMWDDLCNKGRHIPAVGGSDDHSAGTSMGLFASSIGSPTTMVYASELSAAAIVDGIRNGRTVVKLQGPTDPMVTLTTDSGAQIGDTVAGVKSLHVTVTGNMGGQVQLVKNGEPQPAVDVTSDPFDWDVPVQAPATGEDRWRAQALQNGHLITVTSHIWVTPAPAAVTGKAHSGCSTAGPTFWLTLVFCLPMALRPRRQR